MTEVRIQNAIWQDRGRQNRLMCPNYTPSGWWECDVWMVTKHGYGVEFEIKVSLRDFKADGEKEQRRWVRGPSGLFGDGQDVTEKKHELLAQRDKRAPSRFYFVTPEDLLKAEDVPEWAGLLHAYHPFVVINGQRQRHSTVYLRQIKEAPTLHRERVPQGTIDHCRSVFFYRYWNLRSRAKNEKFLTEAENPEMIAADSGDSSDDF